MKAPVIDPAAAASVDEAQAGDRSRKKEEFRAWFFLTFVLAPVLAVLIVAGFGFAVWISQMLFGPPTY